MNGVIAQTRLDVLYPHRANLMNTYNYGLKDIIEAITGKDSVDTWPQNADSYVITFDPKRRCEMIFAVQAQLSELGIAFDTFGTYAPRLANWAGYKEIDPAAMEGVEQRTNTIRSSYDSLNRTVKQANRLAWEIGQMLYQQREVVAHNKHGGFEGWLAAEYADLHIKKAERFMHIYKSYPNIDNLSKLEVGLSVLYKLSAPSTPKSAREEIAERAANGDKITNDQAAEIIASHKPTIPDSLSWLPERLQKAVIDGRHTLSLDHLHALAPLHRLNIDGAPMIATARFNKQTDIPTPAALYNRLFAYSDMAADEVQTVVARMVAVCRPSANEVDCSDFTEADFDDLNQADAGDKSPYDNKYATGTPGYFFINGSKQVLCEATGEVLTLEQFKDIKPQKEKSKPRKSASHSSNGSGGGRLSAQVVGDSFTQGLKSYANLLEKVSGEEIHHFIKSELQKLNKQAVTMLAVAIANRERYSQEIPDEADYVAAFVAKYEGVR